MGISAGGQSLDGDSLDIALLDTRVSRWKKKLGLHSQPEFPPRNIKITEDGIKFHDRSHILLQDFLGNTSEDLSKVFKEQSLPSVFEEILAFFCAKVAYRPTVDPATKISLQTISKDIRLMGHLGYVPEGSIFTTRIEETSKEIQKYLEIISCRKDFPRFRETLIVATKDCPDWSKLEVIG